MSDYTVLYIDEDPKDNNQFLRSFSGEFDVKTVDFEGISFDSLMSRLEEKDFDYLIVDFHLNEKGNCGFNGDDVLVGFISKFPDFPVMLLTNHDEKAIESIKEFDVEKIHSKKEYTDENLKEAFIKRLKVKVDQYREEIKNAQERVLFLIEKKQSGESLSANEEEEMIHLDSFLDKILDGESPNVPKELKMLTNTDRLDSLLKKTDDLIEKLEKYENIQK